MGKKNGSAQQKLGWAFFWLTTAGAAAMALITTPEMPQWSIVSLLFVTGGGLTASAYYFRLFEAPIPIGTMPRASILLAFIWVCVFIFSQWLGPRPRVAFLETHVYLDKPNLPMFANISFQNMGAKGKMTAYGFGAVTQSSATSSSVRQELQQGVRQLIAKGGGLTYSIGAQEKKWFTIFGPTLTAQQTLQVKRGELDFYFAATLVTDPGQERFDFCGFVVGNHPDTVLQCEE